MKTLILFTFLVGVPVHVQDTVRDAWAMFESYQSFEVREQASEDAILVDWQPLPGRIVGQAYCKCFGHAENRIVLNSSHAWDGEMLSVAAHELAHILLQKYQDTWRDPTALMGPSTYYRVERLNLDEQLRLSVIYRRVRPDPQKAIGAWRP